MKKVVVWAFLFFIYGLLSWKNPYRANNLIGNLEPYPDTLYYSVPAWNLVNGRGFQMSIDDKYIKSIVPPLYGLTLVPVYALTYDVRSFYWINIVLVGVSLGLFMKLASKFVLNNWLVGGVGLIWVTNFYNYNLPSLLMAENLLVPLTLATIIILLDEISTRNMKWSMLVGGLLLLTKMSALPVVAILVVGMTVKIFFSKNIKLQKTGLIYGIVFGVMAGTYLRINLPIWTTGNSDMNIANLIKNSQIYFYQIMGKGSTYLWYINPLLDRFVGVLALAGVLVGIIIKKTRTISEVIVGTVITVIMFHALKFYPEGRYVSTVVPLIILMLGVLIVSLGKFKYIGMWLLLMLYFGQRVSVNGFYERKMTTVKRQVMNNFRVENEVPWNYNAVQFFNNYFQKTDNKVYLATLLPAFYVNYFSNQNYAVLPVSKTQEFSSVGKDLVGQYFKNDGSVIKMYQRLMDEGNEVYITNYYLQNHRADWEADYNLIEKSFAFKQVAAGCMDLCKIYKLEIKPTRPAGTLP